MAGYEHLLPKTYSATIAEWLTEDVPYFDYGGHVVGTRSVKAHLLCKSPGVLAGVPFFTEVFRQCHCSVEWLCEEGTELEGQRDKVAVVRGAAKDVLIGERTALNVLARCSGIATRARAYLHIKELCGFRGTIAGTRKTTPGFRVPEKYALLVGGADTHRMDLSSMVMLKDNHIAACGSITSAVQRARQACGFSHKIEVEVRNVEQGTEAATAGADVVMLDNFDPGMVGVAVRRVKEVRKEVVVEVSGGVTEANLRDVLVDGVDVVSVGALTQGVPHVDFSLKIVQDEALT